MSIAKIFKKTSIMRKQVKKSIRKCPTCLYHQAPLPTGSSPKGAQNKEICQMDVFHFVELGKQTCTPHHCFQDRFSMTTALSLEITYSIMTHLLGVLTIMGISVQLKMNSAPVCVSKEMKLFFFAYCNIKHVVGIPQNITGQAVKERSSQTLKVR